MAEKIYNSGLKFLQEQTTTKGQVFGTDFALQSEKLTVSFVSLVYKHTHAIVTTPPSILRSLLYSAMERYPMNHVLLAMFIEEESRLKISGRVRLHVDGVCPQMGSSLLWIYAIKYETQPGSSGRTKSLFERALKDSAVTRRSALLWHQYILFEIGRGNTDGAKNVFYRAIRAVPWYKPVWLEAVKSLSDCFNSAELHDLIKSMIEKEIRIHV